MNHLTEQVHLPRYATLSEESLLNVMDRPELAHIRTTLPILDPAVLQRYITQMNNYGRVMVLEVIKHFVEDVPTVIDQIERAIQGGDTEEVRNKAHTLKGTSAIIGAQALSAYCLLLEEAASQQSFNDATVAIYVQTIRTAYQQVIEVLEQFRRSVEADLN
ncbi:MAG: Hpt domain-containing protein [Chloroflexaceae bacterium]|nr:Hpt domain-containing protein [Chloroflexaceae bacterium]NJO04609.1 Hpt domain-containing protein [Chloroflexaceae bacterium]NJO84336.1 Hpt domain-containing protein [Blastochloris sp.]